VGIWSAITMAKIRPSRGEKGGGGGGGKRRDDRNDQVQQCMASGVLTLEDPDVAWRWDAPY